MSRPCILVADNHPEDLRLLEVSLKNAGFAVTTANNGRDALRKVEISPPDLILSETTLPELDGFAFVKALKEKPEWATIPFLFLSEERSVEHKVRGLEQGVDDYLVKPVFVKELVARLRLILQRKKRESLEGRGSKTKFSGSLDDIGLVDLIQTVDLSKKTGALHLTRESDRGVIYFQDGEVVDAEVGKHRGVAAVYRLLTWSEGFFDVDFRPVRRTRTIHLSSQEILMEGMRRLDEWGRLVEQLPPLDTIFMVDAGELIGRLDEIPDEVNAIIRLTDGTRSLLEIIDSAPFDDLETLKIITRLSFYGIFIETGRKGAPPPRTEFAYAKEVAGDLQPEAEPPAEAPQFGGPEETSLADQVALAAEAGPLPPIPPSESPPPPAPSPVAEALAAAQAPEPEPPPSEVAAPPEAIEATPPAAPPAEGDMAEPAPVAPPAVEAATTAAVPPDTPPPAPPPSAEAGTPAEADAPVEPLAPAEPPAPPEATAAPAPPVPAAPATAGAAPIPPLIAPAGLRRPPAPTLPLIAAPPPRPAESSGVESRPPEASKAPAPLSFKLPPLPARPSAAAAPALPDATTAILASKPDGKRPTTLRLLADVPPPLPPPPVPPSAPKPEADVLQQKPAPTTLRLGPPIPPPSAPASEPPPDAAKEEASLGDSRERRLTPADLDAMARELEARSPFAGAGVSFPPPPPGFRLAEGSTPPPGALKREMFEKETGSAAEDADGKVDVVEDDSEPKVIVRIPPEKAAKDEKPAKVDRGLKTPPRSRAVSIPPPAGRGSSVVWGVLITLGILVAGTYILLRNRGPRGPGADAGADVQLAAVPQLDAGAGREAALPPVELDASVPTDVVATLPSDVAEPWLPEWEEDAVAPAVADAGEPVLDATEPAADAEPEFDVTVAAVDAEPALDAAVAVVDVPAVPEAAAPSACGDNLAAAKEQWRQRDRDAALRELRAAVACDPAALEPRMQFVKWVSETAALFRDRDMCAEAAAVGRPAAEANPANGELWYYYVNVLYGAGQREAADEAKARCRAIRPAGPYVQSCGYLPQ